MSHEPHKLVDTPKWELKPFDSPLISPATHRSLLGFPGIRFTPLQLRVGFWYLVLPLSCPPHLVGYAICAFLYLPAAQVHRCHSCNDHVCYIVVLQVFAHQATPSCSIQLSLTEPSQFASVTSDRPTKVLGASHARHSPAYG